MPSFTGTAEPIAWSFVVSQATGMAGDEPSSVLTLGVYGIGPWEGAILLPPEFIDGGGVAYFRYFAVLGASPQVRLAATTTGDPEGIGPRFTAAVEGYVGAFTFSEVGSTDTYAIPGPTNPTNQFSDLTEPYFWTPPPGLQELNNWLSDRGSSTIAMTIRDRPPPAFNGQASPVSWSFGASQASGSATIPAFTGDAEPIQWSFGASMATGLTVAPHFTGDAGPIQWSFGASMAIGTTVPPAFTGDADPIQWSFGASNAEGLTIAPHFTGDADPIRWSFGASVADGSTVAPHFTGDADPIQWSFGVSNEPRVRRLRRTSRAAEPGIRWSFGVNASHRHHVGGAGLQRPSLTHRSGRSACRKPYGHRRVVQSADSAAKPHPSTGRFGISQATGTTVATDPPSPPLNAMVTTANNQDTVTWDGPSDLGSFPLGHYEVQFEAIDGRWYPFSIVQANDPLQAFNPLTTLQWSITPPPTTRVNDRMFQSFRRVTGNPAVGDQVPGLWVEPYLVSRWGEDGIGIEEVFAVTNSATLPTESAPRQCVGL